MTADGSILIDTKLDDGGIKKGVKKVSDSVDSLKSTVKKSAKSLTPPVKEASNAFDRLRKSVGKTTQSLSAAFLGGKNFAAIFKNIAKLAAAAFIGGSIISSIRNLADSFDLASSSIGDKVKPLSEALETLKGTFVNLIITAFVPLIPYLISAAQWFTNILVTVTQVVAALFGFKTTVGSIMTKAASDAKKAAKEAKGALAAFDQINLLQKQEGPESPSGPQATPSPITVPQDMLDKIAKFKEWLAGILDIFNKLKDSPVWKVIGDAIKFIWNNIFIPFLQWIVGFASALWMNFKETWTRIIANTIETFQTIKENIDLFFTGLNEFITGVFTGDWALAWEGLKNMVAAIFGNIWAIIKGTFVNIQIFLQGWIDAVLIIFKAWAGALNTFVLIPLKTAFGSALDWIKTKFESSFQAIHDFVMSIINGILSAIAAVTNALGGVGAGSIGGGIRPSIPHLATGAVIPPNAAFAAILGDQRSGRNIEAPEGLIRQIMREEMSNQQANVNITFGGSLSELVRILKPKIDQENRRVGGSLLK